MTPYTVLPMAHDPCRSICCNTFPVFRNRFYLLPATAANPASSQGNKSPSFLLDSRDDTFFAAPHLYARKRLLHDLTGRDLLPEKQDQNTLLSHSAAHTPDYPHVPAYMSFRQIPLCLHSWSVPL